MEYVEKPKGATTQDIGKIEESYKITLPNEMKEWWSESDGPIISYGFKELQFFSTTEIVGEDIYELKKHMPNSFPICLDGNSNICVGKIINGIIFGFFVANLSDLGWEESKKISNTFNEFIEDNLSPEQRLNA